MAHISFPHSYAVIQSTHSAALVGTGGSHIIAINWSRYESLWRLRFIRGVGQEGWGGRSWVSYWCAHYCQFCQRWIVPVEQASSKNSKLACMKQENRFYPLPCLHSVYFACHYPEPMHQASEPITREDNYTLKVYLCYKVICSKGVSVKPVTVTWNCEELASFFKCKRLYLCLCMCVCTCVYLCRLNIDCL